jgi:hypothetical protein
MAWTEWVRIEDKKSEGDLTGIYELKSNPGNAEGFRVFHKFHAAGSGDFA